MKSHRWFTIVSEEAPTSSNLSTLKKEAAGSTDMLVTTDHNSVITQHTMFTLPTIGFPLQVILGIVTICSVPYAYFLYVH